MRHRIIILAFGIAVGLGAWWYFAAQTQTVVTPAPDLPRQFVKHDGDAEMCDVIEPLLVERGRFELVAPQPLVPMDDPLPRVSLAPGSSQPPRPDEQRRMPYADDEETENPSVHPLTLLLEAGLRQAGLLER